jgi:glycogen debranching enzyme
MNKSSSEEATLAEECRERAVALLQRNLGPHGILAASAGQRSHARGYTAVFGRDAAVCAIGMVLSRDPVLVEYAATGLTTLAAHQADNGQMPKFVDFEREEADFWYLGCIDSTLWWLIAVDFLARGEGHRDLKRRLAQHIERALHWLLCQEHQRFRLLLQNEASDWADIMPRSGFVLYTNALWHRVKRLYRLPESQATRHNFNRLFHPFSAELAEYRRARLLMHYVQRRARNRELYLSFVNFSFWGEEGDVFGNLLAILFALPDGALARRIVRALLKAGVHEPYPVRAVCDPIQPSDPLWRDYMGRHRQNLEWQYHNGGIWPMVGGFWVTALAHVGERTLARGELEKLALANARDDWAFNEWFHGRTAQPMGMPGQSWNAAAYIMAYEALAMRPSPFEGEAERGMGQLHANPASPKNPAA